MRYDPCHTTCAGLDYEKNRLHQAICFRSPDSSSCCYYGPQGPILRDLHGHVRLCAGHCALIVHLGFRAQSLTAHDGRDQKQRQNMTTETPPSENMRETPNTFGNTCYARYMNICICATLHCQYVTTIVEDGQS